MLKDFFLPFFTVALSELGDKTQLAVLSLSTRARSRLLLFAAVMVAFIIVDGLAVVFGSLAAKIIPFHLVKVIAGIVFVAYGAYILILSDGNEKKVDMKTAFLSVMGMIILLEMGDKSQIAAVLFAAEFNPWLVFLGVELALAILSIMAILLGAQLKRIVKAETLKYVSGIIFIAVGIISLL